MDERTSSKTDHVSPAQIIEYAESLKVEIPKDRPSKKIRRVARQGRTVDPRQLSLPGLAEVWRAMPNHIARSSLFAPVRKGRKKRLNGELLASRKDADIQFWGEQLDEAQGDVWMQIMYEAGKTADGEKVRINRAAFLRSIGRHNGKSQYDWLKNTLLKLQQSVVMITVYRQDGEKRWALDDTVNMIGGFLHDEESGDYLVKVDSDWKQIFGQAEYALIDWKKRLKFGQNQDVAKSLQRLIATSRTAQQYYELSWLQGRLGSTAGIRDFRRSLKLAFAELERLEIISDARIEKSSKGVEQATWTRLGVPGAALCRR